MKKKILKSIGAIVIFSLLTILVCNVIIYMTARGKTYNALEKIPKNRVGLVLGTSNKLVGGLANPFYTGRIRATVELYNANKIDFILVSGDNATLHYNEPITIKNDLIKRGVPEDKIFLDYAGFRTLDSMVRAKEVFGLDSVTVISQKFHNERAIFIAREKGLVAIGFNAQDVTSQEGFKVRFREYFARVKVFLDFLMNTQPKFYGEKVKIAQQVRPLQ
ncbi:MAG: YdcF family protein [Maribacter sp.]|nr:YdcF family protein [Maribacter sp.]